MSLVSSTKCIGVTTFCINGQTFTGMSMDIYSDGKVMIDGKNVCTSYNLQVSVHGDVSELNQTACSTHVTGNVGKIESSSGGVRIAGNVRGIAQTMSGSMRIGGNVHGNVLTQVGSVHVGGNVRGKISTQVGSKCVGGRVIGSGSWF
jgi:hypothetical protein